MIGIGGSAGRSRTTVPQQALFLLNSPFAIEQAQSLAARHEIASAPDDNHRITALYNLLFNRPPTDDEAQIGLRFITAVSQDTSAIEKVKPWEQYAHLLLLTNEMMYVD